MKILDATCSCRGMWFQKENPYTVFLDKRKGSFRMSAGRGNGYRKIDIMPDVQAGWQHLPFINESFDVVVFDPPFIIRNPDIVQGSITVKYSWLPKKSWREDLRLAFCELFRVLKNEGVFILKWSETDISKDEIIKLALPQSPLFGTSAGNKRGSFWITFIKHQTMNSPVFT